MGRIRHFFKELFSLNNDVWKAGLDVALEKSSSNIQSLIYVWTNFREGTYSEESAKIHWGFHMKDLKNYSQMAIHEEGLCNKKTGKRIPELKKCMEELKEFIEKNNHAIVIDDKQLYDLKNFQERLKGINKKFEDF